MEFLRRAWLQIQAQLGGMPASSKVLIGSLLVILLLVGFLAVQYAGQPKTEPLLGVSAERQPAVLVALTRAGIPATSKGGQIYVPTEQRNEAVATLAQDELLAPNTSAAFDEMVRNQTPWDSNARNAQALLLAKQKVLGQIVAKMVNVRSADVMLSMPESKGFGATHTRPSASVNVVMRGGSVADRKLVEAVAGLVSGAVAEMRPQDVVVIDANRGRQFTVKSADDISPGDTLENLLALEQYHARKISDVLGYIPGVIVAVNVRTNPVLAKNVVETKYDTEPLKSEEVEETEQRSNSAGGEAGVRPNTGLSIDGNTGTATVSSTSRSRTEFAPKPIVSQTSYREAGQMPKQISVTVNVPRSYFVGIFRQGQPADAPEPDRDALLPVVTRELEQIESQIRPLIESDAAGVVTAHMIPDARELAEAMGRGVPVQSDAMLLLADSGWVKPVGLGLLALISLGLMLNMVRRATQQPPMPSIEELAGVPPQLPMEDDLVGEANAQDPSMAGMELDEDELRTRKITEQIAEMIRSNPGESATLFNRWIRKEE